VVGAAFTAHAMIAAGAATVASGVLPVMYDADPDPPISTPTQV
jgi:hypothetical protein